MVTEKYRIFEKYAFGLGDIKLLDLRQTGWLEDSCFGYYSWWCYHNPEAEFLDLFQFGPVEFWDLGLLYSASDRRVDV